MKAVILLGRFGKKLRPLTLTCPKPIISVAGKPLVVHQLEALAKAGVTEVIVALHYKANQVKQVLREWVKKFDIKISFLIEETPLGSILLQWPTKTIGTAGCLGLLQDQLDSDFFVLNGDVLMDYPFLQLLTQHKQCEADVTIVTTQVSDPSRYGVVILNDDQDDLDRVVRFVEKPQTLVSNEISAGF